MNWQLILLLSLFGVLMGILSVMGVTKKTEPFFWLVFGFITAFILSKNLSGLFFWSGLIIGVLWGIFNSWIQSIFFNTYLKNNPQYKESFKKIASVKPRFLILIVGPSIGLITGVVLGGLAWFLQRIF